MRSDMARVIVERPRIPDYKDGRKGRAGRPEDLPACEGMRRPHLLKGEGKTLNENLRPLRRYLERQVGRPWNKVYSEIAANLRADNTVQQHVRDHLADFVAVQPRRHQRSWGGNRTLWWQPLYVDPASGLLCRTDQLPEEKARRPRAREPLPPPERIAITDNRELRRLWGTWYEVQLAPLSEPTYRACKEVQKRPLKPYSRRSSFIEVEVVVRRLVSPAVRDAATNIMVEVGPPIDDPVAWQTYRRNHAERRYGIAKRALNRRELRQHGLSNEPPEG